MSIGIEILIELIEDLGDSADYSYGTKGNTRGVVRFDKSSGVAVLKSPSADEDDHSTKFHRVAFKLKKHWQAGELPERTSWAA